MAKPAHHSGTIQRKMNTGYWNSTSDLYQQTDAKLARHVATVVAIILIPQLIVGAMAFPGFIQIDHQYLIAEIATNHPSQWHSLLWGYFAFPFIYQSPSYGLYGILQSLIFTLCITYAIVELYRMRLISRQATFFCAATFGLSPTFLLYNQLYASDVIFSYILAPLTVQVIKLVHSEGQALQNRKYRCSLIFLLFIAFQLRKNAVLIPLVLLTAMFFYYRLYRKKVVQCFTVFLTAALLSTFFWTNIIKATPSPSQEMLSVPAQQIAYVFKHDGVIPQGIERNLSQIRSPKEWKEVYIPYTADPEKKNLQLTPEFIENWITTGLHNPLAYVRAYTLLMNPFWQFTSNTESLGIDIDFSYNTLFTTSPCNNQCRTDYVEQIKNAFTPFKQQISQIQNKIFDSHIPVITDALILVFFNRALPLWIFLGGIIVSIRKKITKDYLLISIPLVCVLISLLCFAPVASFRYAFQTFCMLPIIITYLLARKTPNKSTRTASGSTEESALTDRPNV